MPLPLFSSCARRKPTKGTGASALALVAAMMLTGCRPASERAEMELARADVLAASNDAAGAMAALLRATRLDANNVDAWIKLGNAQLRAGDPTGADQSFQRAQELAPDNVEALDNLVILAVRGDELDRAKRYMDALLVLQPDDPAGLLAQGAIALRERRPRDALAVAERLTTNNPDLGEAFELKAKSLSALGRHREAGEVLAGWAKGHGDAGSYREVLLLLLDEQRADGDVAGVRRTAERLHALDPAEPRYALETARAARADGRAAKADEIVAVLLRAHPDAPDVLRAVLDFWRDMLPPEEAGARSLRLAGAGSPADRLVVANFLIDTGRPRDALPLAMPLAGKAVDAGTADATATLARAQAALGATAAARAHADQVLAFDPGNLPALLVRGGLRLAAGDFDGAIADAQLAQSSGEGDEAATALLARIYVRQGNRPLAQQTYALGLQQYPDSGALLWAYVDWLTATGQPREAIQVVSAFARRHRRDAVAWRRYAALCRAQDDPCLIEAESRGIPLG